MAIKVLCDINNTAVLYDSVTDIPFGYLIHGDNYRSAQEVAEDFIKWAEYFGHTVYLDEDFAHYFSQYHKDVTENKWPNTEPEFPEGY